MTVQYDGTVSVRDVDLALHRGQTVALVGGSGAGKSTVAKAVAGLVTPAAGRIRLELPPGGTAAGSVDLLTAPAGARRAARRDLHLVMQDPYASLPPHCRILDIVAEPLVIHRVGTPTERRATARDMLVAVGLDPERYARRFPHELSGGERQRVAFSRALVTRPAVILADEPTGMLDASLRAEITELMTGLAREHGTAILHITHDLALAARSCDRVIVMDGGEVIEQGATGDLLRHPRRTTTRRLLAAAHRGVRGTVRVG
nr:dipeptide/oligopeptide/nickel ABC transporter ATP-binding protein [Brachybacterium sacelli]